MELGGRAQCGCLEGPFIFSYLVTFYILLVTQRGPLWYSNSNDIYCVHDPHSISFTTRLLLQYFFSTCGFPGVYRRSSVELLLFRGRNGISRVQGNWSMPYKKFSGIWNSNFKISKFKPDQRIYFRGRKELLVAGGDVKNGR